MPVYSEYIIYADESGDHGLDSVDPKFPVFTLSFCVVKKIDYTSMVVPKFQNFKFEIWGHDSIVFHERKIRKQEGDFSFLGLDQNLRENFFFRMNSIITDSPIMIVAAVIDKRRLRARYGTPWNPYEVSLLFCMERLHRLLCRLRQRHKVTHVVFEERGNNEDNELRREFSDILGNRRNWGYRRTDFSDIPFHSIFLPKKSNSTGLQLADLTARPIGLSHLRPDQPNRAFDLIRPKIIDLKIFP